MARVLVADDDPAQLDLRCRLLETVGHQVFAAFSPSEVLRQLSAADIVVTDFRLPDVAGGLALIRDIRAANGRIPLIVISGWLQDLEDQPEANMVSRILQKPITVEVLSQVIEELCGGADHPLTRTV